jgi:hypothetical protein
MHIDGVASAALVAGVLVANFLMLMSITEPAITDLGINAMFAGTAVALYLDHSRLSWPERCIPDTLLRVPPCIAGFQPARIQGAPHGVFS